VGAQFDKFVLSLSKGSLLNTTMPKKFQRCKEDFTCEKCGFFVVGTGYTNHCPKCLWSKHVDVNPGDRQSDCGGMMKPMEVEFKDKEYSIVYSCEKCGLKKRNKVAKEDDFDVVVEIAKKRAISEAKNSS